MSEKTTLSIVIPTYNRGQVLLDTLGLLLQQETQADQILVIDQTFYNGNEPEFEQLGKLHQQQAIEWLRLDTPSIPNAMNTGLLAAESDYVLFLDDDVSFAKDFIQQHRQAVFAHQSIGHVGQIIQPWQKQIELGDYKPGKGLNRDLNFPFNCNQSAQIANCMAGNLCVNREAAIQSGGFDQRFDKTAYRFESEFCKRLCREHGTLFSFAPKASLDHLHVNSGGTRAHGNFFTSAKPIHSACNYYFAFREGKAFEAVAYIFRRFFKSIADKFYLRKPWWIPVRLLAEVRGFFKALSMYRQGPVYIDRSQLKNSESS